MLYINGQRTLLRIVLKKKIFKIIYVLYKWTKDTIENNVKKKKYLKSFTVYVNGAQLYEKKTADYLESEIKKLNEKRILKISKYNSDPKNNPQPPKKYF